VRDIIVHDAEIAMSVAAEAFPGKQIERVEWSPRREISVIIGGDNLDLNWDGPEDAPASFNLRQLESVILAPWRIEMAQPFVVVIGYSELLKTLFVLKTDTTVGAEVRE